MKATVAVAILMGLSGLSGGIRADESEAKVEAVKEGGSMRQRFVPAKKKKDEGNGANWTKLHRSVVDPGVLMAMAHAGVGDSFPVSDPEDRKLFEVAVIDGDDRHLVLEVRVKEGAQRIALVRDTPTEVAVGEMKYDLNFPTVQVGPDSKPTTHLAMIIVKQRP